MDKKTAQKKKPIEPQYLYRNGKPTHVYLSIDDYKRFMNKLEKLSQEAQKIIRK